MNLCIEMLTRNHGCNISVCVVFSQLYRDRLGSGKCSRCFPHDVYTNIKIACCSMDLTAEGLRGVVGEIRAEE
jgi:hypothetical protein